MHVHKNIIKSELKKTKTQTNMKMSKKEVKMKG